LDRLTNALDTANALANHFNRGQELDDAPPDIQDLVRALRNLARVLHDFYITLSWFDEKYPLPSSFENLLRSAKIVLDERYWVMKKRFLVNITAIYPGGIDTRESWHAEWQQFIK